jgi:NAD(P)-dependent dehydrogenase (short-subunit alcohol dehydrogenase family)
MSKPFAIVTGASSGIGLELAAICAQEAFDLSVSGWKNNLQSASPHFTPAGALAEQHRKMAEPGPAHKAQG